MKQLRRLYHQRLPVNALTTPEFAQRLAAISTDMDRPVCAYINRRGQVIRVGVGTPRETQIPPLELPRYGEGRLCGIRCVAAQQDAQPPGIAALTAMAIQRLDSLVVLNLTGSGFQRRGGGAAGYVKETYLAHLIPNEYPQQLDPDQLPTPAWEVSPPLSLDILTKQDFVELVESLESELQREFVARQVDSDRDLALLVGVETADVTKERFREGLVELARLVETAGGQVLQTLCQKRQQPHPQTVVGAGKVEEIALAAQTIGANLVVFDRDLSPAQVRNLENRIGVRVVDRTEVILDIFAQRAGSGAGKLQVELAQLNYLLPRLVGRGRTMSRLGGGIGTRGPGETKLETERRAIQRRIAHLQQEVDLLQAHRARMRQGRQNQEVPSVAIVGYTNAGKSTLLNTLTKAKVYAADRLFATLDPTTRRLSVPNTRTGEPLTIVLTDTVGFIHHLPPSLRDAFRATLEEVTEADALLHLVDLSHPAWHNQVRSVMEILGDMPITPGPILMVFNKIDAVDDDALEIARSEFPQAAMISAAKGLGLESLREKLAQLVDYALA